MIHVILEPVHVAMLVAGVVLLMVAEAVDCVHAIMLRNSRHRRHKRVMDRISAILEAKR